MLIALLLWCLPAPPPAAGEARVAVASNFSRTARVLATLFREQTGHRLHLSPGATGKQYAQIRNGAPFDLFLAADVKHPRLLEAAGIARPGSRFTYAIGQLALWSADPERVDDAGAVLRNGHFRRLAIANPRLAPYGAAARALLEALALWQPLAPRLVRGENVNQAFHFVASGNAELGLVAFSQLRATGLEGSFWLPPARLYPPIEQQAVLLTDNPVARAFLELLRSTTGQAIIRQHGYRLP